MKKILLVYFLLILIIPTITLAALVDCGNEGQPLCTFSSFIGIIQKIINLIIFDIVPAASVLFLIIGGIILMISGGKPELKSLGKKTLVSTIIGMALAYGAWAIINFILTTLGATPLTG